MKNENAGKLNVIQINPNYQISQEDAEQMVNAMNAFKNGEEQPSGRFIIKGILKKDNF